MVFTYTKVTEMHDHGERGYEEEGYEFDYEPTDNDLFEALAEIICNEYIFQHYYRLVDHDEKAHIVDGIERMLRDYDSFFESAVDYYYDELKEEFAEEAYAFEETTR